MRQNRNMFSGNVFWGMILLLLGVSIVLKSIFNIDIQFFRIAASILFIFLGFRMLFGQTKYGRKKESRDKDNNNERKGDYKKSDDEYNFDKETQSETESSNQKEFGENGNKRNDNEYNIIFGQGRIDVTKLYSTSLNNTIEVNTVFGKSEIIISQSIPIRVAVEAVFGVAELPDSNKITFGEYVYNTVAYIPGKPYIDVRANVVFGKLQIIEER